MNYTNMKHTFRASLLVTAAWVLAAAPALAVDLMAVEGTWSPDGGTTQIPMWGFTAGAGPCPTDPVDWSIGPELTDSDLVDGGLTINLLTINLRNCLPEPVSINIPGQTAVYTEPVRNTDGRIRAFSQEAAINGTATYTWANVTPGSYLYQSGSHPAKQVQMGLYGALKVGAYTGTSADVTLLYSEIDPALHAPPTAATPLNYKPRYFLINGLEEVAVEAGDTSKPIVLSFLNAGLDFHVPTLKSGYMSLRAEDGNPYPSPKEQYSVNLAAGKTIDAFWQPTVAGDHVIYDRRGNNMVATLTVGAAGGAPIAVDDPGIYTVVEDGTVGRVVAPGVLDNDTGAALTASLVSSTSGGTLVFSGDGSFTYQPNPDFNGEDSFTYRATDNSGLNSNPATATITVTPVNDPPVAVADGYVAIPGVSLQVAAPGVLANDTDVDGDPLSVNVAESTVPNIAADGSFVANVTGSYTYQVCDDGPLCHMATVTVTAGENDFPVARDDFATSKKSGVTVNVVANDTDANGIDPATVVVSTALTINGGTVTNNGDGTISYKPAPKYLGTDQFFYTVKDTAGAESNRAWVRINVVK